MKLSKSVSISKKEKQTKRTFGKNSSLQELSAEFPDLKRKNETRTMSC